MWPPLFEAPAGDALDDELAGDIGMHIDTLFRHRLLTADEERALFARMAAGDTSARDELVTCNMRMVAKIAMKYRARGMEFDDLISEGVIGMLQAIAKFDPARDLKFSTYATWWIRQAV